MKKALLVGAATLAVSVMVGTGLGSVSASSKDVKEETTLAVESTAAVKATPEEIAALEGKSTPAEKLTPATKATAEEIAEFEKNATPEEIAELKLKGEEMPAVESTPATKATPEEIAAFEKESKEGTPATKSVEASKK